MKRQRIALAISMSVLVLAVVFMVVTVAGLSGSVSELAVETEKGRANVILASANVNDKAAVTVPIIYYDQKMDICVDMYSANTRAAAAWRQFEWSVCGYQNFRIEKELIEGELNAEYLPVPVGGELVTNRGLTGEGFSRWFNQVDGKSKTYGGTLTLTYDAETASFKYKNNRFYPLDEFTMQSEGSDEWNPKSEKVNSDGHNHLFTLNLGIPIQVLANGTEKFEIVADDDTWVFINNKLVIDMGGIHETEKASFEIRNNGDVYVAVADESFAYAGVSFVEKDTAIIRVFHADRDSGTDSSFSFSLINMVPNIVDATLAKNSNGIEVAYDPNNPSYVAPLGESLTVKPNRTKALVTSVVVQGLAAGVLAIIALVAVMVGMRSTRKSKVDF